MNDLVLGSLEEQVSLDVLMEGSGDATNLLVDISLGVVGALVNLVSKGVLCGGGAGSEGSVSVLGNRLKKKLVFEADEVEDEMVEKTYLVSLLGSLSTRALDGLGNVVGSVLDGLHFDRCGCLVGCLVWFVECCRVVELIV